MGEELLLLRLTVSMVVAVLTPSPTPLPAVHRTLPESPLEAKWILSVDVCVAESTCTSRRLFHAKRPPGRSGSDHWIVSSVNGLAETEHRNTATSDSVTVWDSEMLVMLMWKEKKKRKRGRRMD